MIKEINYKGFTIVTELLFKQNVPLAKHWSGIRHKITVSIKGTKFCSSNILPINLSNEEILQNCKNLEDEAKEIIDTKENKSEIEQFFINNGFVK
jgi:hypothetical protein